MTKRRASLAMTLRRALFAMTKRHALRARNDTIILLNYFDIGTFRFV